MKIKSNEATVLRPEGDRILNAALVEIDLKKFMTLLKKETRWVDTDHNSITVFKSDTVSIVLIGMHENAELKKHSAKGSIHVQVLDGKINFTTEQQTVSMGKGQMIALQVAIPHSVVALEESFFLLTMMINDH